MPTQMFESDVFPILCMSLVGLAAIVVFGTGSMLVRLARVYVDYHLKTQMLDRGMGPADIERVLNAHGPDFSDEPGNKKRLLAEKKAAFLAGKP